jgi:outer membrane lipoprotein-sorting protein
MNLLLAAVLLVQDKTAEEAFQKIEAALEGAKTISVKFRADGPAEKGSDKQEHAEGTFILKEGNKAVFTWGQWKDGTFARHFEIISDGVHLKTGVRTPKNYTRSFPCVASRVGFIVGCDFMRIGADKEGDLGDPKTLIKVLQLRAGEDDGALRTLKYSLKIDGMAIGEVTTAYDPKTFKIRKRTLESGPGRIFPGRVTETYEDWILNKDVPEEQFTLPQEK